MSGNGKKGRKLRKAQERCTALRALLAAAVAERDQERRWRLEDGGEGRAPEPAAMRCDWTITMHGADGPWSAERAAAEGVETLALAAAGGAGKGSREVRIGDALEGRIHDRGTEGEGRWQYRSCDGRRHARAAALPILAWRIASLYDEVEPPEDDGDFEAAYTMRWDDSKGLREALRAGTGVDVRPVADAGSWHYDTRRYYRARLEHGGAAGRPAITLEGGQDVYNDDWGEALGTIVETLAAQASGR